jgi:hypothetical protein
MSVFMRRFGKMKILIGTATVLAACAVPVAAQARTAGCTAFTDSPWSYMRVDPLTAEGASCATAHRVAHAVAMDVFQHNFSVSPVGDMVGGPWGTWQVTSARVVSSSRFENPYLQVSAVRWRGPRQTVSFGLHD